MQERPRLATPTFPSVSSHTSNTFPQASRRSVCSSVYPGGRGGVRPRRRRARHGRQRHGGGQLHPVRQRVGRGIDAPYRNDEGTFVTWMILSVRRSVDVPARGNMVARRVRARQHVESRRERESAETLPGLTTATTMPTTRLAWAITMQVQRRGPSGPSWTAAPSWRTITQTSPPPMT